MGTLWYNRKAIDSRLPSTWHPVTEKYRKLYLDSLDLKIHHCQEQLRRRLRIQEWRYTILKKEEYRRSSVDSKSVLSSQRTSRTRIFQSRRTSEQYISRTRMTERPKSPQGLEEKDPSSTIPPLSMLEPPSSPGRRLFTVKQKQHAYFLLDDPLVHPEMLSRRASEICTHSSKVARKDLKSSNSPPMQLERANSVLLEAIRHGDKSTVENMLSTGTSVNATTKDGLTALHVAVNSSADSVVRLLLSKKANSLATSTFFLFFDCGISYQVRFHSVTDMNGMWN
ncbi:predicted protein [Nematostella vectensis]|uniref:Uncharacterized protein n=1 Tax=Nematostella vectensis TaxID=45351 RepID=A7SEU3_NEMVE|nr:predicted protein [Nematostella vectensis]|eukprot:XP_001629831.1 predicted protein [Nematostella vectensis]